MSQNTVLPGGWSEFTCKISEQEQEIFKTAMHGIVGVDYTPFAVQTQVVAGMNYVFLCNGIIPGPRPSLGLYAIHIFKPTTPPMPHPRIVHITAY